MGDNPKKVDGVRDGQLRVAKWLGGHIFAEVSAAPTAAHADAIIYNAEPPRSLVDDAALLNVNIAGLTYGPAQSAVHKKRTAWSKEALETSGWGVGTLLVWTNKHDVPDTEADSPSPQETTLWVVWKVMPDRGKVTIKPFDTPCVKVRGVEKPVITLEFPTNNAGFLNLLVFRLRDAKVIQPPEINLY